MGDEFVLRGAQRQRDSRVALRVLWILRPVGHCCFELGLGGFSRVRGALSLQLNSSGLQI